MRVLRAVLLVGPLLCPALGVANASESEVVLPFASPLTREVALTESSSANTRLVVVSWGGAYTASQQKAYHDPYMAANPGVQIINDNSAANSVALLRAMQEQGEVTWDLIDTVTSDALRMCEEGLVEEVEHDDILAGSPEGGPASHDFGELLVGDCFIPEVVYSTTFGYRKDLLKEAPTSIMDVFDLRKFPGKRAMYKQPVYNLEWALLADGVMPEDIYDVLSTPEGVDRAFAKLDTIKASTLWWESVEQTPQWLAKGEVVMGSAFNGDLFSAIEEEKHPIAMMWDYQIFDLGGWVIPKGTKNRDAVLQYVKFATDTQRLADQAKYISYGPARRSSARMVGKHAELGIEMAPHMPTDPDNAMNALMYDYEWWAEHYDRLNDRFQRWLAKG